MDRFLTVLHNDVMGGAEQYLYEMVRTASITNIIDVVFLKEIKSGYWHREFKKNNNINLIYFRNNKRGILELIKWSISNKYDYKIALTSNTNITSIISLLRVLKVLKIRKQIGRESTLIFARFKGLKLIKFKIYYWLSYRYLDLLII